MALRRAAFPDRDDVINASPAPGSLRLSFRQALLSRDRRKRY